MFDLPDHPDVESALRTGYPRSCHTPARCVDEDWEYENRRDEAFLAGIAPMTDEEREARRAEVIARVQELERRAHEAHK